MKCVNLPDDDVSRLRFLDAAGALAHHDESFVANESKRAIDRSRVRRLDEFTLLGRSRHPQDRHALAWGQREVEAGPMTFACAAHQRLSVARIDAGAEVAKRLYVDRRVVADNGLARRPPPPVAALRVIFVAAIGPALARRIVGVIEARPPRRRRAYGARRSIRRSGLSAVAADFREVDALAALRRFADEFGQRGEMRVDRLHALDDDAMADGDFEVLGDAIGRELFRRPAVFAGRFSKLVGELFVEFDCQLE